MTNTEDVLIKFPEYRSILAVSYLTAIVATPIFWLGWISLKAYLAVGFAAALVVWIMKPRENAHE